MRSIILSVIILSAAATAGAQEAIDLGTAQQLAASADPRVTQLRLEEEQTELRLRTIEMESRPSILIEGQAQYQSEVVELPFQSPGGAAVPQPPKDTFDARVGLEQSIVDPSRRLRIASERARLAEAQARIQAALFGLRREVDEAFFTASLLQERESLVITAAADLEARLKEANVRVEQGVTLPSEAASIEVVLLHRRQDIAELRAVRSAAMTRLAHLIGRTVTIEDRLVLPSLGPRVQEAREAGGKLRERPEFTQMARARDRLEAQKDLIRAGERPRISAYGRGGYGKPGLNFLNDGFHLYWLAGVRVQWKPWNWGQTEREQRILELQQDAITSEEDALARSIERSIQGDLATIDRLTETASSDDRIVALRELIERETLARYDEQVVTASEYVDKQTDVLDARVLRATHLIELAQAEARVLNLLGLEIQ